MRADLRGQGPPRRPSGDRAPRRRRRTSRAGRATCPRGARALARAFWPGPLTLILPRAAHVADVVTGGQDSVGLRVPAHPVARALLAAFAAGGHGIAAPVGQPLRAHLADDRRARRRRSRRRGRADPRRRRVRGRHRKHDRRVRRRRPDAAASGRHRRRGDRARAGLPAAARPTAPRRAPRERSRRTTRRTRGTLLVPADALHAMLAQLDNARRAHRRAGAHRSASRRASTARGSSRPRDAAGYAHDLYANLRALDAADADVILIESSRRRREWLAVRDRLARATHGEDDDRD